MNPTVSKDVVAAAEERDPASAAAEYGAQFRSDVESFVSREAVESCVSLGVREHAPISKLRYIAFVDPSGGSADPMTLAIGHKQDGALILDAVRERRPPFRPDEVVAEFAALLKSYRVTKVTGDRYAGDWPRESFRPHNITFDTSNKTKSELYQDLLPAINSRRVDLLDHPQLVAQIVGLERRTRAPAATASITRRAHMMILPMPSRVSSRCSPPQSPTIVAGLGQRAGCRWTGRLASVAPMGTHPKVWVIQSDS